MKQQQHYLTPFLFAILLHVIVFVFVFFAFNSAPKPQPTANVAKHKSIHIVNAVAVNQTEVAQEVQRLKQQQQQRLARHKAEQRKLYQQKLALQQQRQRAEKAQRALKLEAVRLRERRQALANQQAKLKKQQAVRAAQLKKQQAAKQALLKKQQAEKALQAKLAAERKAEAAARAKRLNSLVDKYTALILNAIYPNWIVSSNQKQLSMDVLINLAANGTVLNVRIERSSGSAVFDRSAVAAIYKSSPLPVPKDPQALAVFHQLRLTMQPEDIVNKG